MLRIHGNRSGVGSRRILKIEPNAITWFKDWKDGKPQFCTEFRTHEKFGKRLYYGFYPLWMIFHFFDMVIANKFKPEWNLGFDTATYYPDADPESTTVDGQGAPYSAGGSDWGTLRSAAGAAALLSSTGTTAVLGGIYTHSTTDKFVAIYRSAILFDISGLVSGATISGNVLSFYGSSKNSDAGTPTLGIVSSSPASNTALAATDFNIANMGTTEYVTRATYAGWSTSGYNDLTLNSSGNTFVNSAQSGDGIVKFGGRTAWDIDNSAPSWVGNKGATMQAYMADETGTSKDPKLTVTYTAGTDYTKDLDETAVTASTISNGPGKTLAESTTIVDVVVRGVGRAFTDVATIVDAAIGKVLGTGRTFNETITTNDTRKNATSKAFDEVATMVDALSKGGVMVFNEVVTIVDAAITAVKGYSTTLMEAIGLVDTRKNDVSKNFAEPLPVVDTKQSSISKIFSESTTLGDVISRIFVVMRTFSESVKVRLSTGIFKNGNPIGNIWREVAIIVSNWIERPRP